ncbi:hypothetical protein KP77_10640 [Jeotgalibacillus alimentarius]|uniref:DUF4256 domain-containing protein n=1 Tax=Jeotgalibacillus alimentarius TaxID=135826 RepID=A0A0C2VRL5_9BACL|nr:DUF4256 domain-containing protein [Jeotgalibacillus alimentarius]KIL51552.1 hypothetical protein KP77_10640 [Jeotgalibacillus alimentarius]
MALLTAEQQAELLAALKARFEKNMSRHPNTDWQNVEKKLLAHPEKLWSLNEMEATQGEPDVVELENESDGFVFVDCAKESPKGRRSVCYDHAALEARKKFPPKDSAIHMADGMGITLLSEDQYRALQKLGSFDLKTSSWVLTPEAIRSKGGALFCDRRYDTVFVYHNGADSYYGARGFRGLLKV